METVNKVKGGKIYVKPLNYIGGLVCIGTGVFCFVSGYKYNIYTWFAPFYFVIFGLMMIASDCNIQILIRNCNFLDVYIGRGLFNIFVGTQVVDQAYYANDPSNSAPMSETFHILGEIVGYSLIGLGFYLIILHCLEKNTSINGNIKTQIAKSMLSS